jgi:hypothetical protein
MVLPEDTGHKVLSLFVRTNKQTIHLVAVHFNEGATCKIAVPPLISKSRLLSDGTT